MPKAADGRRAATIYSVADRAGVSIATVSRVIQAPERVSPSTREKVRLAIEELHYLPLGAARSLAVQRHDAHGLVLPELTGVYYPELLAGYEATAAQLGQSVVLVLAQGKDDLVRAATRLATRVDGLTIMGSAGLPALALGRLAGMRPVVVIAGEEHPGIELVRAENLKAATTVTERLLASGRHHLVFLGDPEAAVDVRERYEGFVLAHERRGLSPLPALAVPFDEAAGLSAADDLSSSRAMPDGIVCANDLLALAVMDRMASHGIRVPEQVAVTGWDDIVAARYVRPKLTTVRQPVRELAELAARRLHERVGGDPDWGGAHWLSSTLVVRESCGTRLPDTQTSDEPAATVRRGTHPHPNRK